MTNGTERNLLGFKYAQLDWLNNHPYSRQFKDGYYAIYDKQTTPHSNKGASTISLSGLDETQHVFIQANNLKQRFEASKNKFVIAETGFGTGLNFLACCQLWQSTKHKLCEINKPTSAVKSVLHFYSVEKYPITQADLTVIYQQYAEKWPQLKPYTDKILRQYFNLIPGKQTLTIELDYIIIYLHLIIGDVLWALNKYQFNADVWFLDGFSPNKNPQMWQQALYPSLMEHSHLETTLSTFSAASIVKRGLESAGFIVIKKAGYAGKREHITALVNEKTYSYYARKKIYPWQKATTTMPHDISNNADLTVFKRVLIIGAGLSGSACAEKIKQLNKTSHIQYQIDVYSSDVFNDTRHKNKDDKDVSTSINGFANCPKYAIAYVRFYAEDMPLAHWSLASYQSFVQNVSKIGDCQNDTQNEKHNNFWQQKKLTHYYYDQQGYIRWQQLKQANTLTGIADFQQNEQNKSLTYQYCGWVDTIQLIKSRLLNQDNIQLKQRLVKKIVQHKHEKKWQVHWQELDNETISNQADSQASNYDYVVIASGNGTDDLLNQIATNDGDDNSGQYLYKKLSSDLKKIFWPVKMVKGQETVLKFQRLHHLNNIHCGSQYMIPIDDDTLATGAGFFRHNLSNEVEEALHQENISKTQRFYDFLNLPWDNHKTMAGYAGVRCYSSDYLPIVGELFDVQKYVSAYKNNYGKDKNYRFKSEDASFYKENIKLKGLFVCTAMGARGVTSSQLAAQILAYYISQEHIEMPVSTELLNATHPTRFINRAMVKKKI